MYMLWEAEHQSSSQDLDTMMRRLKDLSAFAQTHAEILDLREGVEMLAIGMFFGATSDTRFHPNQERLRQLSEETYLYEGKAEHIEAQIKARTQKQEWKDDDADSVQPRLL
jgi:hypothetical protein